MRRNPGPLPEPAERKRLRGNPGQRPLPDPLDPTNNTVALLPVAEVPEVPAHFGKVATDMWERIWTLGAIWIAETDLVSVQLLCETWEDYTLLRHRVVKAMSDPKKPDPWRERKHLRDLRNQVMLLLSALGLSPADRARLGLAEVVTKHQALKLHREASQFQASQDKKQIVVNAVAPPSAVFDAEGGDAD